MTWSVTNRGSGSRTGAEGDASAVKAFREGMGDYNNGDFQVSALLKDVCLNIVCDGLCVAEGCVL